MMAIERIFTAILAMVCIGLLVVAWGFTANIAYDPIGPRPYPLLIFSLLALGCVFLAVRPAHAKNTIDLGLNKTILKHLVLCVIAMLVYAGLFELLGFPIATALASTAIGILFGGRWLKCMIFSVILGIALYILFDRLLDVTLPLGLLSGLGA